MLLHVSPRMLAWLSFASLSTAACSAGTTGFITGTGDGGAPGPTPTATATGTGQPPTNGPDGSAPPPVDAGPTVDMTPRFDLTIEGQSVVITKVTAKIEPASGSDPAKVSIAGQYEQDLGQGQTSTATLTVFANLPESGTDACGVGGREASYLFKDIEGDGSIRVGDTGLLGGSCTMKLASAGASGFSAGSATGVIGGAVTKTFSVTWGQAIPKS